MFVDEFDFGAEDARYLNIQSEQQQQNFIKSFVLPEGFRLDDYLSGQKYFVYGAKGAGKSALLQFVRLNAEKEVNAQTDFYYFQSSFSKQQLDVFRTRLRSMSQKEDSIIDDTVFQEDEEMGVFWQVFLLTSVNKILRRMNVEGVDYEHFVKSLEAAKAIARAEKVQAKYPSLKQFHATLSRDPRIELDGQFEHASTDDFHIYLEIACEKLEAVFLEHQPVYLFVDEMEIYRGNESAEDSQLLAISSLVKGIRDFNERFNSTNIFVVAAVRNEVVSRVSDVLYEVHRVVRDRGVEISWKRPASGRFHPLEKTILGKMVVQDPDIADPYRAITDSDCLAAAQKYFTSLRGMEPLMKQCLDLTWYRPRDLAILFDEAKRIDAGQRKFLPQTITRTVVRQMGQRLWQDALSGLAVKYTKTELNAIERMLRGGPEFYNRESFHARLLDLADMYDDVAHLSDRKWLDVLEDLYRTGVIYSESKETRNKSFYFRGDDMPSFTSDFRIGIHQTLKSELSVVWNR